MKYKYQINLDRLEITYKANAELQRILSDTGKQEFRFEVLRLVRDTCRMYSHEFIVIGSDYDEERGVFERPIGHLHFGSPNPNRPNIYLVYENVGLYDKYLLASRFYMEDALNLEFLQVSKLDIATDFNFNIATRFYHVFKDPSFGLIVNGKRIKSMDETVFDIQHLAGNNTRKRPFANHSPIIKNQDGSLSMRAYNKSKEIDEESHKDYIRQMAGFNRLYRMEVSLGNHKTVGKMLHKLGMTDEDLYACLQDEKTLIRLFRVSLDSLIRVSHKRKSHSILEYILPDEA